MFGVLYFFIMLTVPGTLSKLANSLSGQHLRVLAMEVRNQFIAFNNTTYLIFLKCFVHILTTNMMIFFVILLKVSRFV